MYEIRKKYGWIFVIVWIPLFTFQDALSKISSVFSYIDEAPILLLLFFSVVGMLKKGKISVKKEDSYFFMAVVIFVVIGISGNIIYQYQPLKLVIIDLITNLKFFGAIAFFYNLIYDSHLMDKYIPKIAKDLSVILVILFLIDRIVNIFPAEYRYGIRSVVLFYKHPTYLAGACAFLIAIMTVYSPKKYRLFIFLDLIILVLTLRSKAIVSAMVFVALYIGIMIFHCKLKLWQTAVVGIIAVICAWPQIHFYFIELGGRSARSVMLLTSLIIMRDYFPIGTGFASYASHSASASVNYSPVYIKYGFETIHELRNSTIGTFFDDQFWPIIFGQTGVLGTISYISILFLLLKKIQKMYRVNLNIYMSSWFSFMYLMISSIAEPAFNNSIAVPFALVLAIVFSKYDQLKSISTSELQLET